MIVLLKRLLCGVAFRHKKRFDHLSRTVCIVRCESCGKEWLWYERDGKIIELKIDF